MEKDHHEDFIQKGKRLYGQIGILFSPVFENEPIYFNKYGWRHLIRKGKRLRNLEDQIRRISLLTHTRHILSTTTTIFAYKESHNKRHVYFWTLRSEIKGVYIRIVIRQLDTGRKHFFSIMDEKKKTPR